MLWVDKYRPKTLDHVMVHDRIAQNLKKLVHSFFLFSLFSLFFISSNQSDSNHLFNGNYFCLFQVTEQDCPHLLFYGPSGSGKKTLIMALLRQMFGPGAEKVQFLYPLLFFDFADTHYLLWYCGENKTGKKWAHACLFSLVISVFVSLQKNIKN